LHSAAAILVELSSGISPAEFLMANTSKVIFFSLVSSLHAMA